MNKVYPFESSEHLPTLTCFQCPASSDFRTIKIKISNSVYRRKTSKEVFSKGTSKGQSKQQIISVKIQEYFDNDKENIFLKKHKK